MMFSLLWGSNVAVVDNKVLVAILITSNGWLWHDSGRLPHGDHDASRSRTSRGRMVLGIAKSG
jgi:hypothetical protein